MAPAASTRGASRRDYAENIIMIGPTGVGKTEIARRLAKLAAAPFVKVEASKFTEAGYVGRDVESMVRDLVENAVQMVRTEELESVRTRAVELAEERIIELILDKKHERESPPEPSASQHAQEHSDDKPGVQSFGAQMFGPFLVTAATTNVPNAGGGPNVRGPATSTSTGHSRTCWDGKYAHICRTCQACNQGRRLPSTPTTKKPKCARACARAS